nr:MAG TPA: hypothetical protein [Caudoviricetes sp.]
MGISFLLTSKSEKASSIIGFMLIKSPIFLYSACLKRGLRTLKFTIILSANWLRRLAG